MGKYAVNAEGVGALKALASGLTESAQSIRTAADSLQSSFDENKNGLGPHDSSIEAILEEIREAESSASESVTVLTEKLSDTADAYQELIETDRYGKGGN